MIGVIGLGFVGLTTSLGLAHRGHKVYGYDVSSGRLNDLRRRHVPFHEPHLEEHLKKYQGKRFILCESLADVIRRSKIIFYCVGTPSSDEGQADLTFLKAAIEDSLTHVKLGSKKIFVIKSTVPPLTASKFVSAWVSKKGFKLGIDVGLVSNPEFLREGNAWEDFIRPDRIVIGADDMQSAKRTALIYKSFGVPIHLVSLNSAEFIKYLSNCFLASMISFSNEMAMLAETIGNVDVTKVFQVLHEDRRWNGKPAAMTSYVYPGCGFGGYCLPKDAQAMNYLANSQNSPLPMLKGAIDNNERIKDHVVSKIIRQIKKNETVGILGLAFKPSSDDVRDSPALSIIQRLLAQKYSKIIAYDPIATNMFQKTHQLPIDYSQKLEDVVKRSSVLVLLTSWPEFKKRKSLFKGKVLIDGRYFLNNKN